MRSRVHHRRRAAQCVFECNAAFMHEGIKISRFTHITDSAVRRPISVGIVPVNLFMSIPLQPHIYAYHLKSLETAAHIRIRPRVGHFTEKHCVCLHVTQHSCTRISRFTHKPTNAVSCPNSVGIVPVKALSYNNLQPHRCILPQELRDSSTDKHASG